MAGFPEKMFEMIFYRCSVSLRVNSVLIEAASAAVTVRMRNSVHMPLTFWPVGTEREVGPPGYAVGTGDADRPTLQEARSVGGLAARSQ